MSITCVLLNVFAGIMFQKPGPESLVTEVGLQCSSRMFKAKNHIICRMFNSDKAMGS